MERSNSSRLITLVSLAFILILGALAFLPLINQLGYYRDDWYLIWSGRTIGPDKIIEIFSTDRPFMGVVFSYLYRLLGDRPLNWNIFAFIVRMASGLGFYWLIRLIWPKQYLGAALLSAIFIVYPGFLQQPNANTFSTHMITFTLAIFSIIASLKGYQSNGAKKVGWLILSVILAVGYFFIYEYMIGLEGVRFALLWYLDGGFDNWRNWGRKFYKTLIRYLPYLIAAVGFLFWRLLIFKSTRGATNVGILTGKYTSAPLYRLLTTSTEWLRDLFDASINAWVVPAYNFAESTRLREFIISLGLALLAIMITLLYVRWVYSKNGSAESSTSSNPWSKDALILGFIALLCTTLPVVVADRDIRFASNYDRYTLQSSLGVALFLGGLIFYLVRSKWSLGILCLMIASAIATHYNNASTFRDGWTIEKQYWWQMSWRAPQIKPGTVLLPLFHSGYYIEEDYEVWAPANIIYYPRQPNVTIQTDLVNSDTIQKVLLGKSDTSTTRTIEYARDFNQSLLAFIPSSQSCLHVIDGKTAALQPGIDPRLQILSGYSRIDQIEAEDSVHTPPAEIFGNEPPHTWCYYFQKASLAEQQGNWNEVARLGDEARSKGYKPNDWSEWLPFLEGYAYTGNFDAARFLIPILQELPSIQEETCNRIEDEIKGSAVLPQPVLEGKRYLLSDFCKR